jgi:hypothetical protein
MIYTDVISVVPVLKEGLRKTVFIENNRGKRRRGYWR